MDPMTWVYIGMLLLSLASTYFLQKKNSNKPSSLQDFQVPTAEEGRPVTMCGGDVWIDDSNIIDYGNLSTAPIKVSGGK